MRDKFTLPCRRRMAREMRTKEEVTPLPLRLNKNGGMRTNLDIEDRPHAELRARLKARSSASRAKVTLAPVPWKKEDDE